MFRSSRRRARPISRRRHLRTETLERRDLLAADLLNLDVSFKDGLLDIQANNYDDIIITADGGAVIPLW